VEKIIVSACLLGDECRYDGLSKPNPKVISLSSKYEFVKVCPECLGGLGTPRIPAEGKGDKVINSNGEDVTEFFVEGAKRALEIARKNGCRKAILKARSPSCGKGLVYDGTFTRKLTDGNVVFADMAIKNNILVFTEDEIESL